MRYGGLVKESAGDAQQPSPVIKVADRLSDVQAFSQDFPKTYFGSKAAEFWGSAVTVALLQTQTASRIFGK